MIKRDSLLTGILSGLLAPVAGFWIYYFVQFRHVPAAEYWNFVVKVHLLAPVLSISLAANLGIFMFFIWRQMDQSSRGVLFSTFLYGIIILILKFS